MKKLQVSFLAAILLLPLCLHAQSGVEFFLRSTVASARARLPVPPHALPKRYGDGHGNREGLLSDGQH